MVRDVNCQAKTTSSFQLLTPTYTYCLPRELTLPTHLYSKARLPVVVWRDRHSGATIARSSQPMTGLKMSRSKDDELVVKRIWEAASRPFADEPHLILDCRPLKNAQANAVRGKGFENMAYVTLATTYY